MLPTVWFCAAAVMLTGYVLLDGFDLGVGMLQLFVARSEEERSQALRSIGPVWDGNEVWLLALGGTLVLAFPTVYASAFSGFYLALMIVLWLLILRGVAMEFRQYIESAEWRKLWSVVFGLASTALALVFGVALGNVVRGVPLDASGYFFVPLWTNFIPAGQVGAIDWYTLLVGIASVLTLAVHGSLWIVMKTGGDLQERAHRFAIRCWNGMVGSMVLVTLSSFAVQPNLSRQLRTQPWGAVLFVLTAAGIVAERALIRRRRDLAAFLASCLSIAGMLASAAFGVFPNLLPSNTMPDSSLTVYNAAAGGYGLSVALYWFIPGMALAIGYFIFVYRRFAGKQA
jgi:cytochrome bd ubiquinol oxidase subunit II